MTLVYTDAAERDLQGIWLWNAERYSANHADSYQAYLRSRTSELVDTPLAGNPVPKRPALSYLLLLRRRRGHGHLVVYTVRATSVVVLRYFHTAQDWRSAT